MGYASGQYHPRLSHLLRLPKLLRKVFLSVISMQTPTSTPAVLNRCIFTRRAPLNQSSLSTVFPAAIFDVVVSRPSVAALNSL